MLGINGTILGPRPSGLGLYAKNIIEELDRQGIDFILYTSFPEGLHLSDNNMARVHKVGPSLYPSAVAGHLLRHLWLQLVLPGLLKRDAVSVLLNVIPEGPLCNETPQITVVHDLIPVHYRRANLLQRCNFRTIVPSLLKRSAAIVTPSGYVRGELIRIFKVSPGKAHALPLACDPRIFRPIDPEGIKRRFGLDRYFIYVGNLLPHKNLSSLIDAFGTAGLGKEYAIVIAGNKDPRYFPALLDRADRKAPGRRILFTDYIGCEDLAALISGADALVHPSLFEGFGLTCLEAMACGCPVISSDIPSVREVCADAALYFDPHDTGELAGLLNKLSGDAAQRAFYRHKGLERSGHFSWERCGMELYRIIERCGQ